jgi:hypothetical protein
MYGRSDGVKVSREELYEQVWKAPTSHLAKTYGISDVALGKICKKLNVPKPPTGYWARKAAGYNPRRLPLPKPGPLQTLEIVIAPSNRVTDDLELDLCTADLIQQITKKVVVVPGVLERPHPLIRRARAHLRGKKTDKYGMVLPTEPCLDLRVSKDSMVRALILMNTLFRELESVGGQIYLSDRGSTVVEINGVEMHLGLNERSARKEKPPPKADTPWWKLHEKYSYSPSGQLEIVLSRGPMGERRFKDTNLKKLEARLDAILAEIIRSGELMRRETERREAEEALRQQRIREEAELRRLRAEEQQRTKALEDQALRWHQAQALRLYVIAAADENGAEWVAWASEHADRIDPLTNGELVLGVGAWPEDYKFDRTLSHR